MLTDHGVVVNMFQHFSNLVGKRETAGALQLNPENHVLIRTDIAWNED